jgi:hypothetical protein
MSKKDNSFCWQDSITLKEFFCQRLDDLEEKIQVIFDMNKVSIDKSEQKLDLRLGTMNEFREQLKDQASRFVTRNEMEALIERINLSIKNLELNRAVLEGKASQQALNVTLAVSFLSLLIGLIGLLLKLK